MVATEIWQALFSVPLLTNAISLLSINDTWDGRSCTAVIVFVFG